MLPPRIAITPGEPAGIGPDVVLQAALEAHPAILVALADPGLLRGRAERLGLPVSLRIIDDTLPSKPAAAGELWVQPVSLAASCEPGELNPANAGYVLSCLDAAIDGWCDRRYHGLVTGPINKAVINDAGTPFSGHTEYLAQRTDTPQVVMMLVAGPLRVALATTHLPLRAVSDAIQADHLRTTIDILHRDLQQRFNLARPRILVLGLNPHAGEGGHLGREEIEIIEPVLEDCRRQGYELIGPLPADTAFTERCLQGADAVLAMYHDQGLPVLKSRGFGSAVNVTLGLPVVRTSVDHGTALDLAGSGHASDSSLLAAISLAIELCH